MPDDGLHISALMQVPAGCEQLTALTQEHTPAAAGRKSSSSSSQQQQRHCHQRT
jgi:hypothetical protein